MRSDIPDIDYRRWRQSQRENQYPHFAGALAIFDVKFSSLDIPYDFQVVSISALIPETRAAL